MAYSMYQWHKCQLCSNSVFWYFVHAAHVCMCITLCLCISFSKQSIICLFSSHRFNFHRSSSSSWSFIKNKNLLWLFWKAVLNCSLWIPVCTFVSFWSWEHSRKGICAKIIPVCLYWATLALRESSGQAWEISGKRTVVCASTLSHWERKGLTEAVTQGAPFLGSCSMLNISKWTAQHLPVDSSPGRRGWWRAWAAVRAGRAWGVGIYGQTPLAGFGLFETHKQSVQLLVHSEMHVPSLSCMHTAPAVCFCCLEFLLSAVPGRCCHATVRIRTGVTFCCYWFSKWLYRFSLKGKHQKASKANI